MSNCHGGVGIGRSSTSRRRRVDVVICSHVIFSGSSSCNEGTCLLRCRRPSSPLPREKRSTSVIVGRRVCLVLSSALSKTGFHENGSKTLFNHGLCDESNDEFISPVRGGSLSEAED